MGVWKAIMDDVNVEKKRSAKFVYEGYGQDTISETIVTDCKLQYTEDRTSNIAGPANQSGKFDFIRSWLM